MGLWNGSAWAGPASAPPDDAAPVEPTEPASAEPSTDPAPTDDAASPTSLREADVGGPTLEDGVLPCGLRVIIARDDSLPVAAVVLAVDTGSEDDPRSQPGLVHALAYHLLQGNRELPPGGAAALVQDRGGLASLAIGPAQVRFESLVPISALQDVLWAESQRLRAPTVSAELWASTLRWARRDAAQPFRTPRAAMAAAHGAPGLEHDGRAVSASLYEMVPRAVGQALADRFRYDIATLVVVSPLSPDELRPQIEALFEDLPPQPHAPRDRSPRWRTGAVPQALPLPGEKGERFVWPVAPDPASIGWATVWCKALNRQARVPAEPARARLRCHLDVDPRRATLVLLATGVDDPTAFVAGRIARLETVEDARLVDRQRETVLHEQRLELRTALPLAQRLASSAITGGESPGWRTRPLRWLTGIAELEAPWTEARRFGPQLQPGTAIHLVPPDPSAPKETPP